MLNDIKKVYSLLEDKESKDIFMSRLMYSISGDYKYVQEMFSYQLNRLRKDKKVELLVEKVRNLIKKQKL